jgi:hypothetical protein
LTMIRTTIYPKVQRKNSNSGRNTKNNLDQFLKERQLIPLSRIPSVIWMTPMIMDVFILKEFKKLTELVLSCQAKSIPNPH